MAKIKHNLFKDKQILIVDDQRDFQKLLKGMLFSLGARNIHMADTGESALQKCMETRFDLLFIDYNLGIGKNGRQLLEELKAKNRLAVDSIYMMVTGESNRPMVMGAVEVEPDDYLIKPFSQGLLNNRIQRVYAKKQVLKPALVALAKKDYDAAIKEIKTVLCEYPRYRQYCSKLLTNVYIAKNEFEQAENLLINELKENRVTWALISLAKIYYEQSQFDNALELCDEALKQNRFRIEAHDIKTLCLTEQGKLKKALETIKLGTNISPFSFFRQSLFAKIAYENKAYKNLISACQNMLDVSRSSIHQDISHQLNYVRALMDAAQNCQDSTEKNKFIKEIKLAIKKAKTEKKLFGNVPFDIFETLCIARISIIKGDLLAAKIHISELQNEMKEKETDLPLILYPESIITLLQIGEFELAQEQQVELKQENKPNHDFVESILKQQSKEAEIKCNQFELHNKKGIEEYKKGNFSLAISEFENAIHFAPMNTGSALNLIQALIQVLKHEPSNKDGLVIKCTNTFKLVDGFKLPQIHQSRYKELKTDFQLVK